jgi:hypothetical protein
MDGRKHTVIEAGGKVYNLRLSFNAMADFEKNIGPMQMLQGEDATTILGYRGVIWAAVNDWGQTKITLKEAGYICEDLIFDLGQEGYVKKIQEIINDSGWFGEQKKGGAGKNPKKKLKEPSEK